MDFGDINRQSKLPSTFQFQFISCSILDTFPKAKVIRRNQIDYTTQKENKMKMACMFL